MKIPLGPSVVKKKKKNPDPYFSALTNFQIFPPFVNRETNLADSRFDLALASVTPVKSILFFSSKI